MIYDIINFCDLHWGAFDINQLSDNLVIVEEFILNYDNIDLVVIPGDYFDMKLPLNSRAAILAVGWLHKFLDICQSKKVKKVRIVKGTTEHDNDQLEVFRSLEDENGFFKIFNENTVEETLPGLVCIYCPDETIATEEYKMKYIDNIYRNDINIGFFHGSFDTVLPDIVTQLSKENSLKNVIFEYDFWKRLIKGPLISGHWHDGNIYEHLIYLGSYDRWHFNEEEPKGFGFIRYNTDTEEYFYKKIVNINAPLYITYTIFSNLYKSIDDYNKLIKDIDDRINSISDIKLKIRIVINIMDDKPENESLFLGLKHYYINNSIVKIVIKNKLQKEKKKEQKKKNYDIKNEFGFVLDKRIPLSEKIQNFILLTKSKSFELDKIEKVINKYIKD